MDKFLVRWANHCAPKAKDYSQQAIWDWFGDNGTFVGGAPMCEGYNERGLVDPARTPFERLYFVAAVVPLVALRLRPRAIRDGRLHDARENICRRSQMHDPEKGLAIYEIIGDIGNACIEMSDEVDENAFVEVISRTHTVSRWV